MALSPARMDQMMDEHMKYELNDDVDGVVSTLTDDVSHEVIGAPTGELHGTEQARAFYVDLFKDLKGENVKPIRRYYGDDFLIDISEWNGVAAGNPLGIPGGGKPMAFRILHVLEFEDNGKIRRENVWLDYPAMLAQLGALPSPD